MTIHLGELKEIKTHNADGLCMEDTCPNKSSYFYILNVNKEIFHLPVCEQHKDVIGEMLVEDI